MRTFTVHVLRTERISFEIEAADHDDAGVRYLADGEEVSSETVSIEIEATEVAGPACDHPIDMFGPYCTELWCDNYAGRFR